MHGGWFGYACYGDHNNHNHGMILLI